MQTSAFQSTRLHQAYSTCITANTPCHPMDGFALPPVPPISLISHQLHLQFSTPNTSTIYHLYPPLPDSQCVTLAAVKTLRPSPTARQISQSRNRPARSALRPTVALHDASYASSVAFECDDVIGRDSVSKERERARARDAG